MEQQTTPSHTEQVSELLRAAESIASSATHEHFPQAAVSAERPVFGSVGERAMREVFQAGLSDAKKVEYVRDCGQLIESFRSDFASTP